MHHMTSIMVINGVLGTRNETSIFQKAELFLILQSFRLGVY